MWTLRDITREDAARAAGMPPATLRVWTHRYRLGGKRGGARLYSQKDVAIIACAKKLERAGVSVAEALRVLAEILTDPPAAADILVLEDGHHRVVRGDFSLAGSHADSVTCLWIGHIADHVLAKLGGADVAV